MKPILVTGAAKNLGAAIARQLAAAGHDVVIHFRSSEKEAKQLADEIKAEIVYGDFSTLESLNAFIADYKMRFPQTKGIVNNVGNYLIAPSIKTDQGQWLDLFQTNFFAPVFITQALLPELRTQKGTVVNIGVSGLNANRAITKAVAYAATKTALHFYTHSLAKELAPDIRVNMVSPGYLENAIDALEPEDLPFKRLGTPQELAALVAYLFDPKSSYITGQNIEVAGAVGL